MGARYVCIVDAVPQELGLGRGRRRGLGQVIDGGQGVNHARGLEEFGAGLGALDVVHVELAVELVQGLVQDVGVGTADVLVVLQKAGIAGSTVAISR